MFEDKFVTFSPKPGQLSLVGIPIVVHKTDLPGIHIAAKNLATDFARVTQGDPSPVQVVDDQDFTLDANAAICIIVGSINLSLFQRLESAKKLDFSDIRGKWESYTTTFVDHPFDGCQQALVIAGSDKRGTVFGIYTLSEQIGVSPWYWWADSVPHYHDNIYALDVKTTQGEPSVRYRGIFINDEAPALTGWVREKFGGYNVQFYEKVFELLLRLKANFLWPAMWPGYPNPGASFFTDDEENQRTAEEYGICISTSHHEPMQRMSNEWFAENEDGTWDWLKNKKKIMQFFEKGVRRAKGCESYFTLGMRGEYDRKMATEDPAAIVREVIETQRALIKQVHGIEDAVPHLNLSIELLALYKEVQQQYDTGRLEVPDDVTLLFADDNFGTIRRLPRGDEKKRKGGAGIYYHFEYVGHPRSYKWTNSNSLGKTWQQLQEAHARNAKQIWIFNVGDIKPLEIPLTFAMELAWNINFIKSDKFGHFYSAMTEREFGNSLSKEIGMVMHKYDRLVSLRKHEHIEPETFSILNYNEAERLQGRWETLLSTAETIHQRVPEACRPSSFQLILYPVKASYIFINLQISLARNRLYARQRRNSANSYAKKVLSLFDEDFDLSEEYHNLLGEKWNHIMMQPHYGYEDTWHAPSRDMISGLSFVQTRQNSNPIAGQMGVAVEGHEGIRPGRCNEESDRTHPSRRDLVPGLTLGEMTRYGPESRWFDVYTRGSWTIHWSARAPYSWVKLSKTSGTLVPGEEDVRVDIRIEWDEAPDDFEQEILIEISTREEDLEHVHLPIRGSRVPDAFSGFVEASGYVSIPASACDLPSSYKMLPELGRLPQGSVSLNPLSSGTTSYLCYHFHCSKQIEKFEVLLYFNMTLDIDPDSPMEYDLVVDDEIQSQTLIERGDKDGGELPEGWDQAVQDCVWVKRHSFSKQEGDWSGEHTVGVKLKHSNLVLEQIVVDLGGLRESYLGPPPSFKM